MDLSSWKKRTRSGGVASRGYDRTNICSRAIPRPRGPTLPSSSASLPTNTGAGAFAFAIRPEARERELNLERRDHRHGLPPYVYIPPNGPQHNPQARLRGDRPKTALTREHQLAA